MAPVLETHACEWKDEAGRLRSELDTLKGQLAALQKAVFGKKSEKLPRVQDELRKRGGAAPSLEETLALRRSRRAERETLPTREVRHVIPPEKRCCPKCGSRDLRPLGGGKQTVVYEYIPARLERQLHIQETLACRCGEGIVTAEAPKAVEQGRYGPGLLAHVAVAKCCDAIPLYRQAKALSRIGVPVERTTLGDLFHATARAAEPLYRRLLELIRQEAYVRADETPQRVLDKGKTRRAYVWTFRADQLVAYVHSHTRAGETAATVLGGTKGYLQVDAYSGYNAVTLPEGRIRVGCWAHVRRKFHEALATAPEAQVALDLILELYRIEHGVKAEGLLGSAEHLARRRRESATVLAKLWAWMAEEGPKHPPKSPLGEALRYAEKQREPLERFLQDAGLALDNNASERTLRGVALGRKNYLFVGNDVAGEHLAGLMSLLATCEANGVNPEAYLADVLLRLASHPAAQLDALLPHRWSPAAAADSS